MAEIGSVSPGYFQTMGIPLLRGRDLASTDTGEGRQVVVVNQALSEREWPGQDPLGKRINLGGDATDPDVVVDRRRRRRQLETRRARVGTATGGLPSP